MKKVIPQIALEDLSKAIETRRGIRIDHRTSEGRAQLLEISEEILADPEHAKDILEVLSNLKNASRQKSSPWRHVGEVQFINTAEPIDENHFLLDDIDHLRTSDALGRPLDSHKQETIQIVVLSESQNVRTLASPTMLGFDEKIPKSDFDYAALHNVLIRLQREFRNLSRKAATLEIPSQRKGFELGKERNDHLKKKADFVVLTVDAPVWVIEKTKEATNFLKVTVTHKPIRTQKHNFKKIDVSYIGSGEDLFLKVDIDNIEILKSRESLKRSSHLSSAFRDALANEPDAGLLIVDSMIEEIEQSPVHLSSEI